MSRRALVAPLLASLLASTSLAAPTLPGINVRWDNCYSDGGVANKTFACDTNTGSERLIVSLELDAEMDQVSGMEFYMDLGAAAATLPAWWQLRNAGSCRPTALGMNVALPNGAVNCEDWSSGQAASGIGAYTIGSLGPPTAEIRAAAAGRTGTRRTCTEARASFRSASSARHSTRVSTACSPRHPLAAPPGAR